MKLDADKIGQMRTALHLMMGRFLTGGTSKDVEESRQEIDELCSLAQRGLIADQERRNDGSGDEPT